MTNLYLGNSTSQNKRVHYKLVEGTFVDVPANSVVVLSNLTPAEAASIVAQLSAAAGSQLFSGVASNFAGLSHSITTPITGIAGVGTATKTVVAVATYNRPKHDAFRDTVADAAARAAA